MISAVLLFGVLTAIMEMILLSMFPPKYRLRILGSANYRNVLHITFLLLNLIIHWGTVIGTMSAVLAFVVSIITLRFAMYLFGYIVDGRYYHVGWIKYSVEELQ